MTHRCFAVLALLLAFACGTACSDTAAPADLSYLRDFVGKYPPDVKLWQTEPLSSRLKALLGSHYEIFVANVQTNGPVGSYGDVIWTSGNKPHAGGTDAGLLLADTKSNVIEVYLLSDGSLSHFAEKGAAIPLEGDAKTVVSNLRAAAAAE